MCELDKSSGITWTAEQWQAQYTAAINMLFSSLGSQRDHYRLLSAAASSVERERKEMVMQTVHPRFVLPEQPNKLQTRKLVSDVERADARQFDQSMFFSDKGNNPRPSNVRNQPGKQSKAARARKRARLLSQQGGSTATEPAVTSATGQVPPTPGTKNKQTKGGKVGGSGKSLKDK